MQSRACAKYCPAGKPSASFGLTSQRDGHPCPSALFAGVHGRSLYPLSLSATFLIALNVKTMVLGFDV
ncbi:hypothetical protein ACIOG3_00135 [Yersinia rochesterensis]|uniref:hypothetical protein n=1 Tax=Yersinia TaxID=629 RepID=UPI00130D928C|nr:MULTISPECIES: hypothetical protein [Yersinia]